MKADIFNKPIYQLEIKDAGTIGSAIIVGTTLGVFESLEEGVKEMVSYKKLFIPNRDNYYKYLNKYEKYKKIYGSIKEIF